MKKKILIGGCGGAPTEGVVKSLLYSINKDEELIGMGSEPTDLILSSVSKKYLVPYSNESSYKDHLFRIIDKERPSFLHCQNDLEIWEISKIRKEIEDRGVTLFLPSHETIENCVYKYKTYIKWKEAGVKVPETVIIKNPEDLKKAFKDLGDENGKIWLRSVSIGAAGKGALPTNDYELAKHWIDRFEGWGEFTAAQILTPQTVTWLSIWHKGELIVAQTRQRKGWTHGNRTLSGVTGVTKVGVTYSDPKVDRVAIDAILAVDKTPHGIYGVDMAYDNDGLPNPTEINIGRFFTTVLFFTEAGLNLPRIYVNIPLYNKYPEFEKNINPLKAGLLWLRGMDTTPRLTTEEELESEVIINY